MYNFYRWYPEGKVIFLAPTKPLVAQQIDACYAIMGIPEDATCEMTGAMAPKDRQQEWRNKRVFFLTPQILTNDISRETCRANDIKCLVLDEAHKASGNYAYVQVEEQKLYDSKNQWKFAIQTHELDRLADKFLHEINHHRSFNFEFICPANGSVLKNERGESLAKY